MPIVLVAILLIFSSANAVQAGVLFDAAGKGDIATIERLLSAGTNVDEPGRNAEMPLVAATLAGQTTTVELLISRGADVMARNRGGFTPLHAAVYSGNAEIAGLLLDHGAKLEDWTKRRRASARRFLFVRIRTQTGAPGTKTNRLCVPIAPQKAKRARRSLAKPLSKLAPRAGLEPATQRLTDNSHATRCDKMQERASHNPLI